MSYKVKFSARSDVGNVRTNNEDNLYCGGTIMTVSSRERPFFLNGFSNAPCIFAVFDGMGGEDCGELASLTAAEMLCEHSERIMKGSFEDVIRFAHEANKKLLAIMRERFIQTGTTLALISAGKNSFAAYNLGDSRIYRLNGDNLVRISDDHTLTEDKVRMGLITPQQALKDRDRNVLTRCLGMDNTFEVSPDFYGPFDFAENSRALICSDGLTDMLTHKEIAEIMRKDESADVIVNELVDSALDNGGRDNVTCIVLEFVKGE